MLQFNVLYETKQQQLSNKMAFKKFYNVHRFVVLFYLLFGIITKKHLNDYAINLFI